MPKPMRLGDMVRELETAGCRGNLRKVTQVSNRSFANCLASLWSVVNTAERLDKKKIIGKLPVEGLD
jgi:hypothetical protein